MNAALATIGWVPEIEMVDATVEGTAGGESSTHISTSSSATGTDGTNITATADQDLQSSTEGSDEGTIQIP